jgi:hypothetical protein
MSSSPSGGMRAPLILTITVIAVLGGMYYSYYRNQVEYYAGRNMRLVSMLTAQIEGRVTLHEGFLSNGTLKPELMRDCSLEVTGRGVEELDRTWAVTLKPRVDGTQTKCASIPLGDLLQPIFARRFGEAFDMLLVANAADGKVLYSLRTQPAASSLLTSQEESTDEDAPSQKIKNDNGVTLVITSLTALTKKKGWREYEPLNSMDLAKATAQSRVRLDAADYLLFSQPYTLESNKSGQWLVCGLVSASRFRFDVSAISASVILLAIAVILVTLCCWPFLRIALIHPSQELTITDVALIVLCTIVGASVISLGLLDVIAYHSLAKDADEQLHDFSTKLVGDFAHNIERAMNALDSAENLTSDVPPDSERKTLRFPETLKADPLIGKYPYLTALSWIDKAGQQQKRFDATGGTPLVDVSARDYFNLARAGRTWTVGNKPYVLEWVRSMTTGQITAVLAKNTGDPDLPVVAVATELIDVSQAVRPPGVDIAIIDEGGAVVYHSDAERIGYENFFAETDQNRELRSVVLARRAAHVRATYWGDDKTMFVTPLTHSQWTLVTFRAKRLTRVLNVEAVLLTLLLLLLSATPYFVLYVLVLVIAPKYRAPSLWPDEARRGDYLRICLIYVALLVLFVLNNWALSPWSSFYGATVIPAIAILSTYLVLHRTATPRRFAIAAALWIFANAVLFCAFIAGDLDTDRSFYSYRAIAKTVLFLVAGAVATLTAVLVTGRPGRVARALRTARVPIGYAMLYRLCGVLMLIVGVAMPVAGFFRISRHVESELLVKYAQLRAAAGIEHRIDHLEKLNIRDDTTPSIRGDTIGYDIRTIFGSRWSLWTPGTPAIPCGDPRPSDWTIAPSAATWLPTLYEDSIAIRPLFVAQSKDDLWHWCLEGPRIELARRIRLDPSVSRKLSGAVPPFQVLHIKSDLPEEMDGSTSASTDEGESLGMMPFVALFASTVGLLALFWYAADFIARRVLLIDVSEPHWIAHLPLSPTLGDHIFLICRDKHDVDLVGADPMAKGFLDVSFAELDETDGWDAALEKLDSSAAGRNVRITDFEYGINNGAINERKLGWLERLLALPDRTVIVISTVSPAYVMTTTSPSGAAGYYARWRALLDRFVTITTEDLKLRDEQWKRRMEFHTVSQQMSPRSWLEKETEYNPFLRRLSKELDGSANPQQLLDEIAERAETYYAGLWSSCREDERLLLYQIAHSGLANGLNRRTLRRLIARGLVRRNPNLRLFSETFRLYVLAAAQREKLVSRVRAERGASAWDTLRVPFFIIIISFLVLLFTTQKDLLTTTTAIATALTTGLPVILKLIGVFTERRLSTPDQSS